MRTRIRRIAVAVTVSAVLPLALTACSDAGSKDEASGSASAASSDGSDMGGSSSASGSGSDSDSDSDSDSAGTMSEPFGPACSSVPKDGAGSFDGMAQDPVATAASHNPALSTLVSAVKKAGLVDTLNNAKDITVFAPTNDAFAKIPKADMDRLLNDKAMLTKVLTYHVVGQKPAPKDLEKGSFETLEKSRLTTSGSGGSYKVDGSADVVCGNVKTANANVYIIDSVLMPKS